MSSTNSINKFLIVLVVVLFVISGFLLVNNYNLKKVKDIVEKQFYFVDSLKSNLHDEYDEAILDLERYKGENAELNAFISAKQDEVREQKKQIETLLRDNKLDDAKLAEASNKIADLRKNNVIYINQIDSLTVFNYSLLKENQTLKYDLVEEQENSASLQASNTDLIGKVNIASLIKVSKISGIGLNLKGDSKEKETMRAKKSDELKICFQLDANRISTSGNKPFYVSIESPLGKVLKSTEYGNGSFIERESESEREYSRRFVLPYDKNDKYACMKWKQNEPYESGTYIITYFQNGYETGKGMFNLK